MESISNKDLIYSFSDRFKLKLIVNDETLDKMKLYKFNKGECICSNGDKLDHLYFLVKGKLKIYTTLENGRSILLRFYKPLSIVGDIELLTSYKVKFNVESLGESYLLALSFDDIKKYTYNDPEFLRFVIKHLSHKLYTNSNSNIINILYPVENRLASYLLSISLDENNFFHTEEIKTSNLTEIAELLGTSYRHINRVINKFVVEDIIIRDKGLLVIKDIDKLKELSCGNFYE